MATELQWKVFFKHLTKYLSRYLHNENTHQDLQTNFNYWLSYDDLPNLRFLNIVAMVTEHDISSIDCA